jgi:hypothetical protein
MPFIGFVAAALIGLSLGLIGGGGSILTLPVLVYLFGINPLLATSYSLFVVGTTSLVGAIINSRKGFVNIKTGLLFASASLVTVFYTRKFIIPLIPDDLFEIGNHSITKSLVTMLVFAVLMLLAACNLIRRKRLNTIPHTNIQIKHKTILIHGLIVGLITGLLGIGGGFIIIPALVLVLKLPMKVAIGTSLLIIALNSIVGFICDQQFSYIDWSILLPVTIMAIGGLCFGSIIGKQVPGDKLKTGFGWSLLVVSSFIIIKEILL